MTEQSRPSKFMLVAELFGVITALAFVTSGIVNGFLFYTNWKLNYFLIASPSDVVMTGFIFVTILLVIGTGTSLIVLILSTAFSRVRAFVDETRNTLRSIGERLTDHQRNELLNMLHTGEALLRVSAVNIVGILGGVLVFVVTQTTQVKNINPSNGASSPPTYQFSYLTGLRVSPSGNIKDRCWAAPVLWMGGDRAVIGCRGDTAYVVSTEGLELQPISVPVGLNTGGTPAPGGR